MRRNLYAADNGHRPILLERRELPIALFADVATKLRGVAAMIGEVVQEEERALEAEVERRG